MKLIDEIAEAVAKLREIKKLSFKPETSTQPSSSTSKPKPLKELRG